MGKSRKSPSSTWPGYDIHSSPWDFDGPFIDALPGFTYLLKMVIFHGELLKNQMVFSMKWQRDLFHTAHKRESPIRPDATPGHQACCEGSHAGSELELSGYD